MDDFSILARDFGYKPQGKSAPMKSDTPASYVPRPPPSFNNIFVGPTKRSPPDTSHNIDYDSIFKNSSSTNNNNNNKEGKSKPKWSSSSNLPVFDKPVYDDNEEEDIIGGLPGVKSKTTVFSASSGRYEDDVFASLASSRSPPRKGDQESDHFDDLLGNFGRSEKVEMSKQKVSRSSRDFDDLVPGFGSGGTASGGSRWSSEPMPASTNNNIKATSKAMDDPFVVLESTSTTGTSSQGVFVDPLETIHKVGKSGSTNGGGSSLNKGMFDDLDPLHGFGQRAPAFPSDTNTKGKDQSQFTEGLGLDGSRSSAYREPTEKSSFKYSQSESPKVPADNFQEAQPVFDMPPVNKFPNKSVDRATSPPSYTETNSQADMSPSSDEHVKEVDDIWLTVSEIPLFTEPTRAAPPSRPPPPLPRHASKSARGHFASNTTTSANDYFASPKYSQSSNPFQPAAKSPTASSFDEFEHFSMGGSGTMDNGAEMDSNSAAAAMKDAMDRAEAKFRHAKEVREREHAKAYRNKESVNVQKDDFSTEDDERKHQEREREEQEREKSRHEKERTRETERERGRQAVERATREARERAATEARDRQSAEARLKSERAAVQRAQAEARGRAAVNAKERAERAAAEATERAATEAREKAAVARAEAEAKRRAEHAAVERATAKERAERVAAEATEREAAEAREKTAREKTAVARDEAEAKRRAERAAVERAAAEARKRAAAAARDRAAAAAAAATKMNQQSNDNDLESFFSSRSSSAPRPSAMQDPAPDPLFQNRPQKTSTAGASSNTRKASSATNIVDDLSSIFGGAPSSAGEFQDIEGETEERRRARLERQQRTQERAAKALAEKNNRDLQSQREQEERSRISETLDVEIKRWAAGKEGNLRALLSTLQYVLWPGCGWQPVSLTDLITVANVKKAYRKATLCIHPDKVQQKGANLQQKYVAEKVFDLLKEAWNKLNSEELF